MKKNIFILSAIIVFTLVCFSRSRAAERTSTINEGKRVYGRYCAPCHGDNGDGKGFNAKNLDPRPANHTDIELMNRRTDEDLYNVIDGGGRAAGKSTLMPPWGNTLDKARIEALVVYLRTLCKCKGP